MASDTCKNLLITGATGFLGSNLIERLLTTTNHHMAVLVRPRANQTAEQRLRRLWAEKPHMLDELNKRVTILEGDMLAPNLGLDQDTYDQLAATIDVIVHTAADVNINQTAEVLHAINVEGTKALLDFAVITNDMHGIEQFMHVSTAYVAGKAQGLISEDALEDNGFNSLYEQTKYEAEELVRSFAYRFPATVFRPAQIVGNTQSGEVDTFNTVYYPLKLYLKGQLRVVPVKKDQRLNIVPVDYAVSAIAAAIETPEAAGKTFHLALPHHMQPTAGELVEAVRTWALDELGITLPKPTFVQPPLLDQLGSNRNLRHSDSIKQKSLSSNLLALAPYFYDNHAFSTINTQNLLGPCTLNWREFLPNLLKYATEKGFLNHTGRTVFEQMQVRLSARHNKITYHDVSASGIRTTTSQDMLQRIRKIAAALLAVGIKPLDRIALVGVNSSEYTATDAAIGLIGATSVPLYFTSPFEDIKVLTQRSKSKLIFIGMGALAERAAGGELGIPCVLMGSTPENLQLTDVLTDWDTFLQIGEQHVDLLENLPSADFDDIATIRYTSGTTGQPKGTTFTQQQLEWMGRTMPAILDWETRNSKIRYLSFLPMSHVVEGILVAYAPYFALTDVDIYCLNEFSQLTQVLPKVRPTMFFSVPRFYEKVWNQFVATSAGQRWLAMEDGPARRAFGAICKRQLLKKAGLDACRQLIVGSAPIRMDLLESFRELGIEIHNAFGLTEAPLITLNRLNNNDLGSLGQPLPQTEVRIDDNGEIFMRGPQVTHGYDGIEVSPLDEDGWLPTGDLGHWSEQQNLVIEGRRKGIVVTSYGKNVQPEKVEALLKSIPGVSEAMLVGDARPYCTALIWLEEEAKVEIDGAAFDAEVNRVNQLMSHAEMPKRWAVLKHNPSLSAGELTPNLKLRRNVILEHENAAVDALYEEVLGAVPGALHQGAAE